MKAYGKPRVPNFGTGWRLSVSSDRTRLMGSLVSSRFDDDGELSSLPSKIQLLFLGSPARNLVTTPTELPQFSQGGSQKPLFSRVSRQPPIQWVPAVFGRKHRSRCAKLKTHLHTRVVPKVTSNFFFCLLTGNSRRRRVWW